MCGALSNGYTATYVTRGMFEWTHPAATKPDLIITLQSANPEQVTLAIVAAKVNQVPIPTFVCVCYLTPGADFVLPPSRRAGPSRCWCAWERA
eukprot:1196791-Rhodomonas_salina.4